MTNETMRHNYWNETDLSASITQKRWRTYSLRHWSERRAGETGSKTCIGSNLQCTLTSAQCLQKLTGQRMRCRQAAAECAGPMYP